MMTYYRRWTCALLVLASLTLRPAALPAQEAFGTIRSANFDVHYANGIPEAEAQKVSDYLQGQYQSINVQLGLELSKKVDVRIYDSVGRFLAEAGLKKPWRGAYYARGILHVQPVQALTQRKIFENTLSYECARVTLEPVGEKGCPLWLRESYAAYRAGSFRTMTAPLGAKLSSFSDLNQDINHYTDPPQRDDVQYMLGQTMNFLVQKYGEKKAMSVFRDFDGMKSVDTVFRRVFGEDFAAIEKSWAKHLERHTTPFKK
jgi:hypothetical protein